MLIDKSQTSGETVAVGLLGCLPCRSFSNKLKCMLFVSEREILIGGCVMRFPAEVEIDSLAHYKKLQTECLAV